MRKIMPDEKKMWETTMFREIVKGMDLAVDETWSWLNTPSAKKFFYERNGRMTDFFNNSGIAEEWDRIVEARATNGVDLTEQIFDYARAVNMENPFDDYTATEKMALNKLCDYNYELIKNVTQDEITAIRRKLVQDFAEGTYPLQTSLKQLQLEPINGRSPESRAETIARTESARVLNVSTLETMRNDGVRMVILSGCDEDCAVCREFTEAPIPIDEAIDLELPHPNCTGVWISYRENE